MDLRQPDLSYFNSSFGTDFKLWDRLKTVFRCCDSFIYHYYWGGQIVLKLLPLNIVAVLTVAVSMLLFFGSKLGGKPRVEIKILDKTVERDEHR